MSYDITYLHYLIQYIQNPVVHQISKFAQLQCQFQSIRAMITQNCSKKHKSQILLSRVIQLYNNDQYALLAEVSYMSTIT
ncbi:unnamed protein product [Paramecium octaurelia]|uniref:Uncharacterized protein n=1 Tax=Paramecium octaurelia TaxID=43137 RepID=A0A8S1YNJ0_PAROT|nr:unnamed protein product [Paramecium octaurelia]